MEYTFFLVLVKILVSKENWWSHQDQIQVWLDAAIQVIAYLSSAHPDGGSPEGLHGQGDEAGDGVSQGQMKHQKVDVGATSKNLKMFQRKLEEGFSNIENAYSESVVYKI